MRHNTRFYHFNLQKMLNEEYKEIILLLSKCCKRQNENERELKLNRFKRSDCETTKLISLARISHTSDKCFKTLFYFNSVALWTLWKFDMKEELFFDQVVLFPRHLQVFWNRSADLWQHLWDNFLEYAGAIYWKIYSTDHKNNFCHVCRRRRI